jgi:diacylglycerol kinase (ATP)
LRISIDRYSALKPIRASGDRLDDNQRPGSPAKQKSAGPFDRIYLATCKSARGLAHAFRNEAAIRDEVIALAIAIPAAILIAPNIAWYLAMLGALLGTIAVELLNTAIEKLADHVAPEWHSAIGAIKDYGSAAVAAMLALAAMIWLAAILIRLDLV